MAPLLLLNNAAVVHPLSLKTNAPLTELVLVVSCQDRVVIAVAYDCVDEMVYWSDITAPAISRARMSGGDVVPLITKGL